MPDGKWTDPKTGVVTYLGQTYHVVGYAGPRHPAVLERRARVGDFLVKTWNIGSSKDMEVQVWKARMARGEVSKIEVSLNGKIVESYKCS